MPNCLGLGATGIRRGKARPCLPGAESIRKLHSVHWFHSWLQANATTTGQASSRARAQSTSPRASHISQQRKPMYRHGAPLALCATPGCTYAVTCVAFGGSAASFVQRTSPSPAHEQSCEPCPDLCGPRVLIPLSCSKFWTYK